MVDKEKASAEAEAEESRIAFVLVDRYKDFNGLRAGGAGRSRHGHGIYPCQRASGLGGRTASRSATRLQEHCACDGTQNYSCQPAAAFAADADTQTGEAETRDR